MAVRIRLTRLGRKKKPFYRIIVADSESKRDGKFLDVVGTYDPLKDPAVINIDNDKLQEWLGKGALPTTTVQEPDQEIIVCRTIVMEELIAVIARSLVDQPDAVKVTRTDEENNVILELAVAPEDLGKVIGKQGRTARALRSLLAASAAKVDKRSRLEIVE